MKLHLPAPTQIPELPTREELTLIPESYRDLLSEKHHPTAVLQVTDDGDDFVFCTLGHKTPIQGISSDQAIGRRLSELQPTQETSSLLHVLRRLWRGGKIAHQQSPQHRGWVDTWQQNTLVRLPSGKIAILSEDAVLPEHQVQTQLDPDEALKAVMDNLPSYVYVADMQTHKLLFMNRWAKERCGGTGLDRPCWSVIHDRPSPCSFCANDRLIGDDGTPRDVYRCDLQDAATGQWLESRDQAIRWGNGQLVRMTILTDITQRKRAEEDLRLAALSLDVSDGILILNADAIIVKVNEAFTSITGYLPEEVIGETPYVLDSNLNESSMYQDLRGALARRGRWTGEAWSRRKDGDDYPCRLNVVAARDETHNVAHYVAHLQDISERKRFEVQMARAALCDPLTNLPNRRVLLDRLGQRLLEAQRHFNWGAVLFLDLDHLKQINDQFGHATGDTILCVASQRLAAAVRKEDTVARFGGDEFVVLLCHLGEGESSVRQHAWQIAGKLRQALEEPITVDGQRLEISASIGATIFTHEDTDADIIIRRADRAMYAAKKAGKNRISLG